MTEPLVQVETAAPKQEQCKHGKEFDRLLRNLEDAAWSVENAVSEIPSAEQVFGDAGRTVITAEDLRDLAVLVHAEHEPGPQGLCRRESCMELNVLLEHGSAI